MNQFGKNFRLSIFGESHGNGVGVIVDGCPSGTPLVVDDFESDLLRRKSGAKGTTPRIEADKPKLMSGVFNDFTTGAPITIFFENTNTKSGDYEFLKHTPRPGHADFVASKKFGGFSDYRGGGHFSGRITLGLVSAGVIAKKIIGQIKIEAKLIEVGGSKNIEAMVEKAITEGDSVGGLVECRISNLPIGLGEPFFDSVESVISHMVFSIPSIKGVEFGSGFSSTKMFGSEHNDLFVDDNGKTKTNFAGGINGGITNGNDVIFRVAVKPTSSISKTQKTFNMETKKIEELNILGRHDACIALRVPVVLENAVACAVADLMLSL